MPFLRTAAAVASALLFCLPAASTAPRGGGPSCAAPAQSGDHASELFFAVLAGLYRDGVDNTVVDALLVRNDDGGFALFVGGCPICTPVLNAFRAYRARPEFVGYKERRDSFGNGLPADVAAACTGPDLNARFEALHALIEGWVARHLADRRLTADEAQAWRRTMEGWREKGMAGLRTQRVAGQDVSFESCAVCDAANGACAQR